MADYEIINEIAMRATWYKPKKTQPDGEMFRQDVITLIAVLRKWQDALGEFQGKVKW